jgi:hypothetical protein
MHSEEADGPSYALCSRRSTPRKMRAAGVEITHVKVSKMCIGAWYFQFSGAVEVAKYLCAWLFPALSNSSRPSVLFSHINQVWKFERH